MSNQESEIISLTDLLREVVRTGIGKGLDVQVIGASIMAHGIGVMASVGTTEERVVEIARFSHRKAMEE